MASYLLSYDLMKEQTSADYVPLWNELKRLGAQKRNTQFGLSMPDTAYKFTTISKNFSILMIGCGSMRL